MSSSPPGHVTAAWMGFEKYLQTKYIYEVLDDSEILEATRRTMLQSAEILMALHPGEFTSSCCYYLSGDQ